VLLRNHQLLIVY